MVRISKSPVKTLALVSAILVLAVALVTACWDSVSTTVFPNTRIGLYEREFWENFLVGMHGIVFELSVIGLLLVWLDSRRSKTGEINRLKEDLDDYALLDFPEINVKKLGHIKRLNEYGVFQINVQNLVLNELRLQGIEVRDSKLIGLKVIGGSIVNCSFTKIRMRSSNFEDGTIKACSFDSCDLLKSKFGRSQCKGVNFSGSSLERADFTKANLQSGIFNHCNVRNAKFDGANLKHASFQNAEYISAEGLAKADNLDYVKVSEEILKELIELRPDIKFQKNYGRP